MRADSFIRNGRPVSRSSISTLIYWQMYILISLVGMLGRSLAGSLLLVTCSVVLIEFKLFSRIDSISWIDLFRSNQPGMGVIFISNG